MCSRVSCKAFITSAPNIPRKMDVTRFLKTLGPGVLFASTAIGVSHLVQSTRAGADFGFALMWAVVAANLFKYPFFEFGSRYANATGTSLIDGYLRMGRWALGLYVAVTLASMFFVSAAVTAVTSGFLQNLFGIDHWGIWATAALFGVCGVILAFGRFSALDSLIKLIGAVLLVSTLMAFFLALWRGPVTPVEGFAPPDVWTPTSIGFIIALMGWMPTAVDLSTWNSLWTVARIRQTQFKPTLRETLFEFNLGYIISAVLALCFVTLGAFMLYGSGKPLPDGAAAFSSAVVSLYTAYIGEWGRLAIEASAFSIMFGTCIAVLDGYARSMERVGELVLGAQSTEAPSRKIYQVALLITVGGAFAIIYFFGAQMKNLVDVATTISFLIAPVVAAANFWLVTSWHVPKALRPGKYLRLLSWAGLAFLTAFTVYFLWLKLR